MLVPALETLVKRNSMPQDLILKTFLKELKGHGLELEQLHASGSSGSKMQASPALRNEGNLRHCAKPHGFQCFVQDFDEPVDLLLSFRDSNSIRIHDSMTLTDSNSNYITYTWRILLQVNFG